MFAPENSLVTIWSAPNYCYRCGNVASIMAVREGGVVDERSFQTFEAGEWLLSSTDFSLFSFISLGVVPDQDRKIPNRQSTSVRKIARQFSFNFALTDEHILIQSYFL